MIEGDAARSSMATGSMALRSTSMDNDELLKKRTDCPFFITSPPTCDKGSECEFRHCETARLNPRECWYWLKGNCLNPTCAFRHPPTHAPASVNKLNTPCYFFFNAICVKGDWCPFMHDTSSDQRIKKQFLDTASIKTPETKTSIGSDTGPASVEVPANPLESTSELNKHFYPEEVLGDPAPVNVFEDSRASAESSMPELEDPTLKMPENSLSPVEHVNGLSTIIPDQSSEELMKEYAESDEGYMSSSGFDVLVDDGSELVYENDTDYLPFHEKDSELHGHILQYDFEGSAGCVPQNYTDTGYYDHAIFEAYDHLGERYIPDYYHRVLENPRESESEREERERERLPLPMYYHKREPLPREHAMGSGNAVDLRDHLKKRRKMEDRLPFHHSRRHPSYRDQQSSRERPARHLRDRRLESEVGKTMTDSSVSEIKSVLDNGHRESRSGYPQFNRHGRSRLGERGSRRRMKAPSAFSSKNLKASVSKESRDACSPADFTGPKTLAQIREEKTRMQSPGSHLGDPGTPHHGRIASVDFEGPKPLTELLKEKKRPLSVSQNSDSKASASAKEGCNERISSQNDPRVLEANLGEDDNLCYRSTVEKQNGEYESDSLDDLDDDEEDSLRKKLAHIFA
ncbi:CCCH zinc finger domain-containing protein [Dioscorea alata]|uniref:CCCH zinc finger domain-containing protein n=1 Tax=Dioscorea alata TaxID=55571 RepID=A0ACB7W2X8_DIOAL|nr:CCCH zinc finger domain-containing protein [Dioscorea alata]